MERVALNLCPHCLAGCSDHPNGAPHRCLNEGCALYEAMVPYEGLAQHVGLIASFNAQEGAAVLRLINAARAVFNRADWNNPEMYELRDALAGVAGFDVAALVVPAEPPCNTETVSLHGDGAAVPTSGEHGGSAVNAACGCHYYAEQGIPCQHDVTWLHAGSEPGGVE